MNTRLPDFRLLRAFGNEEVHLAKVAGGESLASRFVIGLMEANRSLDTRRREELLSAQAQQMNNAFRMMEDRMMAPVRGGAEHTRMPMILAALQQGHAQGDGPRGMSGEDVPLGMDEGMVRMASAIGRDLAVYAFDKEAGIGSALASGLSGAGKGLMKGLGTGMAGLSKGLASAGRGLGGAATGVKNFAVGSLGSAKQMGGSLLQGAKAKLQGAAQGIQNVGAALKTPVQKPFAPATAAPGATVPQGQPATGSLQAPPQTALPKKMPTPTAQPTAAATQAPAAVQAGKGAPPSAGKVEPPSSGGEGGFDPQKFWDRTGLSNGQWKTKLPMLAAGALGAYGLYAGAKKGFEVLGREPTPEQYGAGGAIPAYGVNQYGVPDRNTPFM